MCEHDPQRSTRRMRHSQPVGRYNQLAAVGQSNRGGKRPTVYNQRNEETPHPRKPVPLERRMASCHSLRARASELSPFDVGRCLPVDAPFAYRLANCRGCKPSKRPVSAAQSSATTNNLVSSLWLASITANMKSSLLATALCVGLAINIIAQSPTPAPSPAQPPADYDLRWGVKIPMRDKVELNATLYLPKTPDGSPPKTPVIFTLTPYISDTLPCARRLLRVTRLCVRARRCSRPRKFRRRVRAVRK